MKKIAKEALCLSDENVTLTEITDKNHIQQLAKMIVGNKAENYYAIGDIVSGRITNDGRWNQDYLNEIEKGVFDIDVGKTLSVTNNNSIEVGMAYININKKYSFLEIWDINIKDEYKSCGYGRSVLTLIESYAKHNGIKRLLLESSVNNEKAHKFFEKHGFKRIAYEFEKKILTK